MDIPNAIAEKLCHQLNKNKLNINIIYLLPYRNGHAQLTTPSLQIVCDRAFHFLPGFAKAPVI